MLRKRTRSPQKDHRLIPTSHFGYDISSNPKTRNTPFLNVPSFFKNSESRSPTSPLDFRILSSFGNPFTRPKASTNEAHPKSWDCPKVGLSIIDDEAQQPGNVTRYLSDNKNILFGRKMSIRTLNGGKGYSDVVFEIGEEAPTGKNESFLPTLVPQSTKNSIPSDPGSLKSSAPSSVRSGTGLIGSIPANEIELSEDYTCVTIHGPNPKVIHFFGDCLLEFHDDQLTEFPSKSEYGDDDGASTDNNFLKFCCSCNKKLDGEDIYMYRGEKAFCSYNCRLQEIEIDEDNSIGT